MTKIFACLILLTAAGAYAFGFAGQKNNAQSNSAHAFAAQTDFGPNNPAASHKIQVGEVADGVVGGPTQKSIVGQDSFATDLPVASRGIDFPKVTTPEIQPTHGFAEDASIPVSTTLAPTGS